VRSFDRSPSDPTITSGNLRLGDLHAIGPHVVILPFLWRISIRHGAHDWRHPGEVAGTSTPLAAKSGNGTAKGSRKPFAETFPNLTRRRKRQVNRGDSMCQRIFSDCAAPDARARRPADPGPSSGTFGAVMLLRRRTRGSRCRRIGHCF
jgi:hypothetical protein